ncbi:MAG: hypothetical protein IT226_10285 [Flavobacteriales bacterium]|nr:hypothetical protein [Flavobacteriales bacterium]
MKVKQSLLIGLLGASLTLVTAVDCAAFHIRLHGLVTEYFTGDGLKDVQVRLVKDSVERGTVFTNGRGEYELFLERGYDYQVWYYRQDLVPKFIRIDASEIPLFPDVPFYDMDVQMTLFEHIAGFDFAVFDEYVGLAEYKHSVRNLNWDIDYTERRRPEIARVMILYERAVGDRKRAAEIEGKVIKRGKRKRVYF